MALKTIQSCRICDCPKIEAFLDLGMHPFANAFLKKNQNGEKKYPLTLSFCHACSLVQLNETADPEELFSNYLWVTGTSSVAKQYAKQFCRHVLSFTDPLPKGATILEVASNDGTFLKEFAAKGKKVLGIEPAANIAALALSQGIPTECLFFGSQAAQTIQRKHGKAQVVIARNVLPHVADIHDFLRGLAAVLAPNGVLVLEVHDAGVILEELHYDSIYHEHLCYFSLKSLKNLLREYGFKMAKILSSPISGGSIVAFAQKDPKTIDPSVARFENGEAKKEVNVFASWRQFAQRILQHKEKLLNLLEKEIRQKKRMVGYGASARSSTLLNFCGISTCYLSMIADQNQLKHNLFTPGSHIPIQSPDAVMATKPDTLLVLAWNFFQEIQTILRERYRFSGGLIKPLPGEASYARN